MEMLLNIEVYMRNNIWLPVLSFLVCSYFQAIQDHTFWGTIVPARMGQQWRDPLLGAANLHFRLHRQLHHHHHHRMFICHVEKQVEASTNDVNIADLCFLFFSLLLRFLCHRFQHAFGPSLDALVQARQCHRDRHNSWQISNRLVVRAQEAYEAIVEAKRYTSKDDNSKSTATTSSPSRSMPELEQALEEARIRLRIAREEETKCRKRVNAAAKEVMRLKRVSEEQQQQNQMPGFSASSSANITSNPVIATAVTTPSRLNTPTLSFGSASPSFSAYPSPCPSPVLPMTPTMPAMTFDFDLPQYDDVQPDSHFAHLQKSNSQRIGGNSNNNTTPLTRTPTTPHQQHVYGIADGGEFSIHMKEVRRVEKRPAKLVHCGCGSACLCSAVSSLFAWLMWGYQGPRT